MESLNKLEALGLITMIVGISDPEDKTLYRDGGAAGASTWLAASKEEREELLKAAEGGLELITARLTEAIIILKENVDE